MFPKSLMILYKKLTYNKESAMVVCPKAESCKLSTCPHKSPHSKGQACDNFVCERIMPQNAACVTVEENPVA